LSECSSTWRIKQLIPAPKTAKLVCFVLQIGLVDITMLGVYNLEAKTEKEIFLKIPVLFEYVSNSNILMFKNLDV